MKGCHLKNRLSVPLYRVWFLADGYPILWTQVSLKEIEGFLKTSRCCLLIMQAPTATSIHLPRHADCLNHLPFHSLIGKCYPTWRVSSLLYPCLDMLLALEAFKIFVSLILSHVRPRDLLGNAPYLRAKRSPSNHSRLGVSKPIYGAFAA